MVLLARVRLLLLLLLLLLLAVAPCTFSAAAAAADVDLQLQSAGVSVRRQLQASDDEVLDTCTRLDISGDGVINVPDLLALLSYYGCASDACCDGCDSNDDGRVNVAEVLNVRASPGGQFPPRCTQCHVHLDLHPLSPP